MKRLIFLWLFLASFCFSQFGKDISTLPASGPTNATFLDSLSDHRIVIDLNTTHSSSDGTDHSYIDQSVISGATPTFSADNFSDGGSNAIITTTQETNFGDAYSHISADGSSHSYIDQDVTTSGTPTFASLAIEDGNINITLNVNSVTISNGGFGYTAGNLIFSGGGGGSGAAGTYTVSVGVINGITLTNSGTGYTSTPTVDGDGGGGGSATLVVVVNDNRLILPINDDSANPEIDFGGAGIYSSANNVLDLYATLVSFPAGYTRHIDIEIGSAVLGPNAPTATTVGTFRGLGFDADNEEAFVNFQVPADWNGTSDMTFVIHWHSTSGDAVANGETVKWDVTYRSIAAGEAVDNGTVVSITSTFTGGGSETDKEHYETSLTIDYDNGNQPLTAGDDIGIQFDRDVGTDTYTGAGIVYRIDLTYTSNKLPEN